ncbi:hypothetical protein [Bacillus siamensis]|uniref:hypothetical protein n=1 Tax=Bacillus siamensis TaxID=659243 RepID=UPI000646EC91|nr:hypothetical protein [Bacillus siamensis]
MENNMLQAILDEIKKIDNKVDGIASELNSFKEDTKKEFEQINQKLDRMEENEPEEIMSMLKLINKNIERDHRYTDKKFSEIERRIHDLEERLNN